MTGAVRLGPLAAHHRPSLEEIVRSTGVFNEDEVGVALELFDEAISGIGNRESGIGGRFPIPDSRFPDYEFLGAFDGDGTLVGYACFGSTPSTDNTFDLYWIAVHPRAQRTGAGGLLMAEVERILQGRRARLLVVETSSREEYAPTRRFYAKRGYQQSASIQDFYAHGDHRVVLTKTL